GEGYEKGPKGFTSRLTRTSRLSACLAWRMARRVKKGTKCKGDAGIEAAATARFIPEARSPGFIVTPPIFNREGEWSGPFWVSGGAMMRTTKCRDGRMAWDVGQISRPTPIFDCCRSL